jgi:hypothetical protein
LGTDINCAIFDTFITKVAVGKHAEYPFEVVSDLDDGTRTFFVMVAST